MGSRGQVTTHNEKTQEETMSYPPQGEYTTHPGYADPRACVPTHGGLVAVAPILPARKSLIEAYLLWFVFGLVGMHHFYLNRPYFGVLYMFTFGLCGAGVVIDFFRMKWLVDNANERLADKSKEGQRNISDAYTLWFPFGLLGFHHFYLRNHGMGVLYLFTFGIFGIGWLVDLVRIPYMVRNYNERDPTLVKEKNVCAAYVIAMSPLGILGVHHFYLNRPFFGLLYFFTFGLLGLGWIFDWFRIPILVRRANMSLVSGKDEECHLDDAYILWFPLGILGLHHFYMKRPLWGILYFCSFGLLGIGWLVDVCRIPSLVREHNATMVERRGFLAAVQPTPVVFVQVPTGYHHGQPHIPGVQPVMPGGQPVMHGGQPVMHGGYQNPCFYPGQQYGYDQRPPSYQQQDDPTQLRSYMAQPPPYVQNAGTTNDGVTS